MNTVMAKSRYDKSKSATESEFRFLTLAECKQLSGQATVLDLHGQWAHVKITSLKTWKTRPDVRIGWKFGLYEYGQELITCDDDNHFFIVSVQPD